MKNIFLYLALILAIPATAQPEAQDPEAKKILDRVAEKNKSHSTIQADFEFAIINRREDNTSSSSGHLKIKGEKYYMESFDTKVYFNGENIWSYMQDVNEVTITKPSNEEDVFENPIKIFELYNQDFKYRLVGEVKMDIGWVYEIDLFPNDLDQPYSRFKILVKRDSDEIYMIKAVGKDGIDYRARFKNFKYDETIGDEFFTFEPEKFKNIEVIDLRF